MQLFQSGSAAPIRAFTRLGAVGAHDRAGYFVTISKDLVYGELRSQACKLGADAIVEIVETETRRFEWHDIDVSGVAIRFNR